MRHPFNKNRLKVAIVHYWLYEMRGGEKVIEGLCKIFPDADIFTHVLDSAALSPAISRHKITTTFINRLPFSRTHHRYYLPFMPMALEALDLQGYDLVISSESGPAKGIICNPHAVHICYCHSPLRQLWDQYHLYSQRGGFIRRMLHAWIAHRMRIWDVSSAARVNAFVANSNHVAARIDAYYHRTASVIHPPIDIDNFRITPPAQRTASYLVAGALVPYKRVDLAIDAFNELGLPLTIIGDGGLLKEYASRAKSNIQFLGRVDDETFRRYLSQSRALVFPGEEDFGIVPLEAMASGIPVLAYGKGGIRDTVRDGETGIFFEEQTVSSLIEAVRKLEDQAEHMRPDEIRAHATKFNHAAFEQAILDLVQTQFASKNSFR